MPPLESDMKMISGPPKKGHSGGKKGKGKRSFSKGKGPSSGGGGKKGYSKGSRADDDDDDRQPQPSSSSSKGKGKNGRGGKSSYRPVPPKKEIEEIEALADRILIEKPKSGQFLSDHSKKFFSDLPISSKTLCGLKDAGFVTMTQIQRAAIPHALAGRDMLAEARTGSGKTLAFLVPVLETLFRERFTPGMDGVGALIISPVRELAYQIFQVLKEVGRNHDFAAGCVVGGRDLAAEQKGLGRMNVLVSTPGRLVQHLEESVNFDLAQLKVLVLDEADRILDLGFKESMASVLESLPSGEKKRQSLLFSATLRPNIQQLAAVALKQNREILSLGGSGGGSGGGVALRLQQTYCRGVGHCILHGVVIAYLIRITPLPQKIRFLFSFLRAHSQKKIIVFASSCKQVRFLFELFTRLKPGPAVFEFHGKMSLTKRLVIYNAFLEKQKAACLLSTDVASRGVDFPEVDWVVQLDCPDSVDTYVHRVGRTARYDRAGESLLFLLPSERKFLDRLAVGKGIVEAGKELTADHASGKKSEDKVDNSAAVEKKNSSAEGSPTSAEGSPTTKKAASSSSDGGGGGDSTTSSTQNIKEMRIKDSRLINIHSQAQSILSSLPAIRHLASKCFVSYCKSYHLMPDKEVFGDIQKLPLAEFADSLGLGVTPVLELGKMVERKAKTKEARFEVGGAGDGKEQSTEVGKKKGKKNKIVGESSEQMEDVAPAAPLPTIEDLTWNSKAKREKNRRTALQNLNSDDDAEDGAKKPKKGKFDRRAELQKQLREQTEKIGGENDDADDAGAVLVSAQKKRKSMSPPPPGPAGEDADDDSDLDALSSTLAATNTRLRSGKLKIDPKTGVTKVKGVQKNANTHLYFDEDEEGEEVLTELAHVAKQLRDQNSSDVEMDKFNLLSDEEAEDGRRTDSRLSVSEKNGGGPDLDGRGKFLAKLQSRRARTAEADRELEKQKHREKFLKRKQKLKESAVMKDEIQECMIGGESSSNEDDGGSASGGDSGHFSADEDEFREASEEEVVAAPPRKKRKMEGKKIAQMSVEEMEAEAMRRLLDD